MNQKSKEHIVADKVLRSQVAMTMLRVLIHRDMPLPVSRIAKEIGSNYATVGKYIKLLKEADLVVPVEYGERTLYKANETNERVQALKGFLQAWSETH